MNATTPAFLSDSDLQLVFFGGKGGVGKTSSAVATALRLARTAPEAEFLLVSTDPAHSLTDSLAGLKPPSNLQVVELDAQECLAVFKRRHGAKLREIGLRGTFLDHQDIGRFLDLSLPGLDELMALLEISAWTTARQHRTIIVDTAPSGHTLRLLAMPALLKTWLEALDALLAKHRYLRRLYGGHARPDEIDAFLAELGDSARRMQELLCHPARSRFVPVMVAEPMSFAETSALLEELQHAGVPVTDIIVNRLLAHDDDCAVCADACARQSRVLGELFGSRLFAPRSLWGVPFYTREVCGTAGLPTFWDGLTRLTAAPAVRTVARVATPRWVETATSYPAPEQTLLLFAGKGGVGKTTLACASSLRLAQAGGGREVLLFSADPAHSLSHCLGVMVGPTPKRICPGLTALEIDAAAEFRSLQTLYLAELRSFLHSLMPGSELALDRPAMERIMDLAPPGLDEVMALLQVMDLCGQNEYSTLVLDAAPTGHLIRLLEMPEMIDQWLKVFFGLFLKYEHLFRLPRVVRRLVEISQALKRLRAMLDDPAQAAVVGVSILSEMAFAETEDLLAACQRMHISVPRLLLNQATPAGDCPLCSALRQGEARIEAKFHRAFPTIVQTLVYRGGDPRGVARLSELGQQLYGAPVSRQLVHA